MEWAIEFDSSVMAKQKQEVTGETKCCYIPIRQDSTIHLLIFNTCMSRLTQLKHTHKDTHTYTLCSHLSIKKNLGVCVSDILWTIVTL